VPKVSIHPAPKGSDPLMSATLVIDQRFVDRVIARAQNSAMGLGDPKNDRSYSLDAYASKDLESLALLLISAHETKYDLVSLAAAAFEEIREASTP
jgi:hypothetical protein